MSAGPLSRDEQMIARRMFRGIRAMGWDFDSERQHAVTGMMGCSHVKTTTGEAGAEITTQGIGWGTERRVNATPDSFDVFITWTRVREHFQGHRTTQLREACRVAADRALAMQVDTRWHHPGNWPGVPYVVPVNDHGWTRDEVRVFYADIRVPELAAARAEEARLLDLIYPATGPDPEPVDLFDLLALTT